MIVNILKYPLYIIFFFGFEKKQEMSKAVSVNRTGWLKIFLLGYGKREKIDLCFEVCVAFPLADLYLHNVHTL